jgi:anti-anti-sigma factor
VDVTIDLGRPAAPSVIAVRGDLDVHSASALREALHCLLQATGDELLVDASDVQVLDDAGRATLEGVARHCREYGGQLRLPADTSAS